MLLENASEEPIRRHELLRRVAITCHGIIRNIAYHRALTEVAKRESNITRTMFGNCIDLAVLDWLKLNDGKAKHSWQKVMAGDATFFAKMLQSTDVSADEWEAYIRAMKRYRDKFVAHLDFERTMQLPALDLAKASTEYYFAAIKVELNGSDDNYSLAAYYQVCLEEGDRLATALAGFPEYLWTPSGGKLI